MLNDDYPVKPERTGWRDQGISERHRRWGVNCPAVDLDFVLCEFDQGKPFAIIEYKCETAPPVQFTHPTMRALSTLADESKHPFLLVIYARDYNWYRVHAVNWYAAEKIGKKPLELSEQEYIALLYELRGRRMPTGRLF